MTESKLQDSMTLSSTETAPTLMRVRESSGAWRDVEMDFRECTIGSAPHCTLSLAGDRVRGVHCCLFRGERNSIVRRWAPDALLNEKPFDDAVIRSGDRLQVGEIEIEFVGRETTVKKAADFATAPGSNPQTNASSSTTLEKYRNAPKPSSGFLSFGELIDLAPDDKPQVKSPARSKDEDANTFNQPRPIATQSETRKHLSDRARKMLHLLRRERADAAQAIQEVDALRADLEAATGRLASLESIRNVERGQWAEKESRFSSVVESLRQSVEKMEADYASAREELAESIAAVATAESTITTLSDMEQAAISNAYSLGEQLDEARRQCEEAEVAHQLTLDALQAEIDALREHLSSTESEVESIRQELVEAKEEASRTQVIPEFESEIARLNASQTELQEQIDEERDAWSAEREAWEEERTAWQELLEEEQRARAERERNWDAERQEWTDVREEWETERESLRETLEEERTQRAEAESAWEEERRTWTDVRRKLEEESQNTQSQWNDAQRAWSEREEDWNRERRQWTEVREKLENERQAVQDALNAADLAHAESESAWESERQLWTDARQGLEAERQELSQQVEDKTREHAESEETWNARILESQNERDQLQNKVRELEDALEEADRARRDDTTNWEKERLAWKSEREEWNAERGSLTRQLTDERDRLARKTKAFEEEAAQQREVIDGLNDEIGDLQHELSEQRKLLLDAQEMLDVSTKAGFELETEVAERKREVEQQQEKWVAERESWEEKLKNFEKDLAKREQELAESIAAHEAHKANETKWEEERKAWSVERDGDRRQRSAEAEKWNAERDALQNELDAASSASREAHEQIAAEREEWNIERERIEGERQALESRLSELQQATEENESEWRESTSTWKVEMETLSEAVDSLETTNRQLREQLAQTPELLAVKSDVDAARIAELSENESKLNESHRAAIQQWEDAEAQLAAKKADLDNREAEFAQLQAEWAERFRDEKAEWERRLGEIEARESKLADGASGDATCDQADSIVAETEREEAIVENEWGTPEWTDTDEPECESTSSLEVDVAESDGEISEHDDAELVDSSQKVESYDDEATRELCNESELDHLELEPTDAPAEQNEAHSVDEDQEAAFAHLRDLNIINEDFDDESESTESGAESESFEPVSYLDQCVSDEHSEADNDDSTTHDLMDPEQQSAIVDDSSVMTTEEAEALEDRRKIDRDESDDDSLNEYMDNLMRRVRGESSLAPVPSLETVKTPTKAAPSPTVHDEVAPAPQEKMRLEDIKTAGTPPERQANFAALRTLANSSARSAISTHDSSLKRQNATSKALIATAALMGGALTLAFSPAWLSLQSVIGVAAILAGAYWSGKTLMTVLHNMRVDAWDDSDFASTNADNAPAEPSVGVVTEVDQAAEILNENDAEVEPK